MNSFKKWAFTATMGAHRQLRSGTIRKASTLDNISGSITESMTTETSKKSENETNKEKIPLKRQKKENSSKENEIIAIEPIPGDRIIQKYTKLIQGKLLKRYKRFLADIELEDGTIVTVHCPNTGPMVGLLDLPNALVQLSLSNNIKRKYIHTLEMIQVHNGIQHTWVGVHSASANQMVYTALKNGWLSRVVQDRIITSIQKEVKHTKNSRIDFVIKTKNKKNEKKTFFIEVKSVTLGIPLLNNNNSLKAIFPDTISKRASKHIEELIDIQKNNNNIQTIIIFLIQRNDCITFSPSYQHDPIFAAYCKEALLHGVELHAYNCILKPNEETIHLNENIPIEIDIK